MEKEIVYVNIDKFYSKKRNETFYQVHYIANKKCIIEFISEELYNTLNILKLEYLSKYIGIFDLNASNRTIQLVNIKTK